MKTAVGMTSNAATTRKGAMSVVQSQSIKMVALALMREEITMLVLLENGMAGATAVYTQITWPEGGVVVTATVAVEAIEDAHESCV